MGRAWRFAAPKYPPNGGVKALRKRGKRIASVFAKLRRDKSGGRR
jgi:hypothetical protein